MTETERLTIKEALPQRKPQDTEEVEVEQPDIKLEAITHMIRFVNGNGRIKTETFEIQVPLEICLMIKEILTHLGTKNKIPDGRFIPYGLEVYKKMLRMQNEFLTNFWCIFKYVC
jgi:hypothetical protein